MGKKSKKKAARSQDVAGASGAIASQAKNVRCAFCSGTVKVSEGKGHTCVGCSQVYCSRCEKKMFRECPNGNECAHLIRRCPNCYFVLSLLSEMGIEPPKRFDMKLTGRYSPKDIARMYADRGGDLQRAIVPFGVCHDCNEDETIECFKCALNPKIFRLLVCNRCKLLRCVACHEKLKDAMQSRLVSLIGSFDGSSVVLSEFCAAAEEMLVQEWPTFMFGCNYCSEMTCVACLEGNGLTRVVKDHFQNSRRPFCCNICYYAKKPCTNPTCPNRVGIPTKRCGGCHISRYCSKDCQAADFPEHEAKCERMQEKVEAKNSRASTM